MNLEDLENDELISLYPKLLKELKRREIIRTNNLISELGEFIAASEYKKNSQLPQIQLNLKSTKNVDAISIKGERYAIKSISGKRTGVFASLPNEDDGIVHFEYLILVIFNNYYTLKEIYELTWKDFLCFRKMKPPENKWNLPITNVMKENVKQIF